MSYTDIVLHVDDDPQILALVARKLESRKIQVVSISDPASAIKVLLETGARIVLLDIDMPGIDGLSLLKEIKKLDAGVQVIMCTGMVSMNTILRSTSLGAETCIFKPFDDLDEVTDAIERAFDKISRWRIALQKWLERKKRAHGANAETAKIESQLSQLSQVTVGCLGIQRSQGVTQVSASLSQS